MPPVDDALAAGVAAASLGISPLRSSVAAHAALLRLGACGGPIVDRAGAAQAGSKLFDHPILVYGGEISYSVYMICIPWQIVFVNSAARVLQISGEQLPLSVWIVGVLTIIPLSALSYHLIEKPARAQMKSWADAWQARRLSAASG